MGGPRKPPGTNLAKIRIPERYAALLDGRIKIEDLDDEEINRGQLRAKDGTFKGGQPTAIPRQFFQALQMEQQRRFQEKLPEMVEVAQKTLTEVMMRKNPMPGDAARVNAAKYIIDRFAGKVPDNVNVHATVAKAWDDNVEAVIVPDIELEDDEFND